MATTKVTVTLDDQQLEAIRKLVASGKAQNVSSFVRHAVGVSLMDVAGWGRLLARALEQSGGPLTKKERAWADSVLETGPRRRRRRKVA
ncbi:MAG: ribbon-helix-helix domain-containing protein [Proteobacteria bacterium]|nr:ribbon-helix-helix domain-containing protein [Pseudomonadota bacterium]